MKRFFSIIMWILIASTPVAANYTQGLEAAKRGDFKTALELTRPIAEKGNPDAQYLLGAFYQNGDGVPQDYQSAAEWFQKAADQGHAAAQNDLGTLYAGGRGVPQSFSEAFTWVQKAAGQGHVLAQFNLGFLYKNGQGVPQDFTASANWFQKAAEKGHAVAQYQIGLAHTRGQGLSKNHLEAAKWFRKAAEQGYARAQYNIGYFYVKGMGVPRDLSEAAKWFRKAAEQGIPQAQADIGLMHAKGQGVGQDSVKAYMWLSLAAAQGMKNAQRNLGVLSKRITSSQKAQGEQLAADWKPSKPARRKPDSKSVDSKPKGTGEYWTDDFEVTAPQPEKEVKTTGLKPPDTGDDWKDDFEETAKSPKKEAKSATPPPEAAAKVSPEPAAPSAAPEQTSGTVEKAAKISEPPPPTVPPRPKATQADRNHVQPIKIDDPRVVQMLDKKFDRVKKWTYPSTMERRLEGIHLVYYVKGEDKPFTGLYIDPHSLEVRKNGLRDGLYIRFYKPKKGEVRRMFIDEIVPYKMGIKEGVKTTYFRDGTVARATTLKRDLADGPCAAFNKYSKTISEIYGCKDGKRHGTTKSFDKNGLLEGQIVYEHGEKNGPCQQYYSDGTFVRGTYLKDKKHGKWQKFVKGKLEEETTYQDGKLEGPFKRYYPSGQVKTEETYQNGKKKGPFKRYNPDGSISAQGDN